MILTLGDSFTYGDELDNRLEQAWPYLIGKYLGQPVENLGQNGGSNDATIRLLLGCISKSKYNLVIIGWATPTRFEAWDEFAKKPMSILPEMHTKLPWVNDYYRYSYNEKFSLDRWAHQVILVQEYLKSRNQSYLFVNVAGFHVIDSSLNNTWNQIDQDYFVGWPDRGMIEMASGTSIGPGGHPLEEGHQRIADEIKKYIRN